MSYLGLKHSEIKIDSYTCSEKLENYAAYLCLSICDVAPMITTVPTGFDNGSTYLGRTQIYIHLSAFIEKQTSMK